jgi:hypothetical protein
MDGMKTLRIAILWLPVVSSLSAAGERTHMTRLNIPRANLRAVHRPGKAAILNKRLGAGPEPWPNEGIFPAEGTPLRIGGA